MLEELYKNNKPLFIALIIIIIIMGSAVSLFNRVVASSPNSEMFGQSDEVLAPSPNRGEVLKNPTTPSPLTPLPKGEGDSSFIYVHIAGAVKKPGVYKMPCSSRIVNIVELAGGFLPIAKTDEINLAETLKDGQKISVAFFTAQTTGIVNNAPSSKNIVNINTADESALDSLPGIGPSAAKKIIEYRNKNGPFKAIEEIKNVSGFKDKKFEKIKGLIRVE